MRDSIFATPSEPVFNFNSFSLSPTLLEESLHVLAEENEKSIDDDTGNHGLFKDEKLIEFIFRICQKLELSPPTRYVAVELFDRFMAKHISELYDIVRTSSSADRKGEWDRVEKRIKEQLPLRLISSIQVASKLVSHYKALTPSKSRKLLSSFNINYTTASVAKSEIRILKTLNFKVAVSTPLTFIETLLEILGLNSPTIKVKIIHEIGTKVLDAFYLNRRRILKKLCNSTSSESSEHNISLLGSDYLLLATAIIVAATYFVEDCHCEMMVEQLVAITHIPIKDIIGFANILVQEVLDATV
eukprot:gene14114-15589_t